MPHATGSTSYDAVPGASSLPRGRRRHRFLSGTAVAGLLFAAPARLAGASSPVQCARKYGDFMPSIYEDLLPWQRTGITEDHIERMMEDVIQREPYKGGSMGIAILNNTVYVMNGDSDDTAFGKIPTCGGFDSLVTYLRALDALADAFPLPDVELVLSNRDTNERNWERVVRGVPAEENERAQLPYLRYARSDAWNEILIPNYHIYEYGTHRTSAEFIEKMSTKFPWPNRSGVAFGSHTCFTRGMDDHYTLRLDRDGQPLRPDRSPRAVLANYSEWIPEGWAWDPAGKLQVGCGGSAGMEEFASHKYVVQADGLGWSDKLTALLMTGSCVLLEESGFRSFFGRQLRPFVHYVPFWRTRPQELADAVEWARAHDDECREIGNEAQQFAGKFFTVDAIRCYWLMLLTEYARAQRFVAGRRRRPPASLVEAKAYVERARAVEAAGGGGGTWRAIANPEKDWVY